MRDFPLEDVGETPLETMTAKRIAGKRRLLLFQFFALALVWLIRHS